MEEDAVDAYLRRIGTIRPDGPTLAVLADLQIAHLLHVPFENLDIHLDVDIVLDPESIHDKVVARRRGGYCYELNSSFAGLLERVGFGVTMLSARVVADGEPGPEFDHMALLVTVPGTSPPFLVDVGFGDAFTQPIPLVDNVVHPDRGKRVRVRHADGGDLWSYDEHRVDEHRDEEHRDEEHRDDEHHGDEHHGEDWSTQYVFGLTPRSLEEFAEMNEWQQRSPDSHFRQQPVCSLLTSGGRVTVSGDRLITTAIDGRTERTLSREERTAVLRESFGIELARTL